MPTHYILFVLYMSVIFIMSYYITLCITQAYMCVHNSPVTLLHTAIQFWNKYEVLISVEK